MHVQLPIGSESHSNAPQWKAVAAGRRSSWRKIQSTPNRLTSRRKPRNIGISGSESAVAMMSDVRLSRRRRARRRDPEVRRSARRFATSPSFALCAAPPSRTRACSLCLMLSRSTTFAHRSRGDQGCSMLTRAKKCCACRVTKNPSPCSLSRSWTILSSAR